ncbi:MAG TPA: ECF-type sigma factor, partial [Burkholderiaceae bacterium]|nr:ECF-type sigma factor [Burkholderiaceae bacterium]
MKGSSPAPPVERPSVQVLFPSLYNELRRLARLRLAGGGRHTLLDTSSLVHEALETLARVDARLVSVVEMRYFAGLSDAEIAAALGLSDRTVRRDWERAR